MVNLVRFACCDCKHGGQFVHFGNFLLVGPRGRRQAYALVAFCGVQPMPRPTVRRCVVATVNFPVFFGVGGPSASHAFCIFGATARGMLCAKANLRGFYRVGIFLLPITDALSGFSVGFHAAVNSQLRG